MATEVKKHTWAIYVNIGNLGEQFGWIMTDGVEHTNLYPTSVMAGHAWAEGERLSSIPASFLKEARDE